MVFLLEYKNFSVKRIAAAFFNTVYKVLSKTNLDILKVADIYYHLPHVYIELIEKNDIKTVKIS